MLKPLFVTFGMAGFLLSSAAVAQAHVSACTLCTVPINPATHKPDTTMACGGTWPDFQAAFFSPNGNHAQVHAAGCTSGLDDTRTGPGPNLALCCVKVNPVP